MKVAYISGSYRARTIFGVIWNILKARKVALKYWRRGYAVICPHMNTALFDGKCPDDVWLKGGIAFIRRLRPAPHKDVVIMMEGWRMSEGAKAESAAAAKRGVEVRLDY